jgi:transcriptional regulator with XRE-family HTH domain
VANETTKRLMARVKQIRLARGLTQEQFAERADLDPKYYQHAEAGRKPNPELETLLKLANACGLKLCELFDFDREPLALAEEQSKYDAHGSSQKAKIKGSKSQVAKKATKAKGA